MRTVLCVLCFGMLFSFSSTASAKSKKNYLQMAKHYLKLSNKHQKLAKTDKKNAHLHKAKAVRYRHHAQRLIVLARQAYNTYKGKGKGSKGGWRGLLQRGMQEGRSILGHKQAGKTPKRAGQGRSPRRIRAGQGRSPKRIRAGQGRSPKRIRAGQGRSPQRIRKNTHSSNKYRQRNTRKRVTKGRSRRRFLPMRLQFGGLSTKGRVRRKEIAHRIGRIYRAHLRYCYNNLLYTNRKARGLLVLRFQINQKGQVASVRPTRSTIRNRSFTSCVLGRAKRWRFSRRSGEFTYRITFQQR